jgi:2-succinyl-6-hydroxy-2,4-cyclohexadiene-1-carboxylate synthase
MSRSAGQDDAVSRPAGRAAGAGSVIALHGFLGQPSTWDEVAREHGGLWRTPRLPGHGPDAEPGSAASFLELASAFGDAILPPAESVAPPPLLVGYSMGARVALGVAIAWPSRVRGLVLVGAHGGIEDDAERETRRRWDDEHAARLLAEGLPSFLVGWESLPVLASQQALSPALRERERTARLGHQPAAVAWALGALGLGRMPPLAEPLAQMAASAIPGAKIHFIAGARDPRFVAEAARLTTRVPGATSEVIGAGHNVALEAPGALARAILRADAAASDAEDQGSQPGGSPHGSKGKEPAHG